MNKKQIHVIVKYFVPVAAGIETNVLETYSVLVKKGWDVTLHTTTDTLTERNILPLSETIRGIKVFRYPFKGDYFGYHPKINFKQFEGIVCLHNFNIYYINFLFYFLWLKVIGMKKFSVVITPHGGFNPEWRIFSPIVAFSKKLIHYTIGSYLIDKASDKVRAVSEWERREIVSKHISADKVITISNGLEDDAYKNIDKLASNEIKDKVKNFGRYLVQVGRVYMIKNYETVIKSMPYLPKDIKFVVAGPIQDNDGYINGLKKLVSELGLDGRVIFLGVIRGIDKYYLIKHSQMMVHMALWESYCNVVHEGMSQGLICIVANNTALPLLIQDGKNGFLVETKDFLNLSKKINYVLNNEKSPDILEIKKRSKEFGLQDSWENVADRMNSLYLSLINND